VIHLNYWQAAMIGIFTVQGFASGLRDLGRLIEGLAARRDGKPGSR
jgi:hypothetical protein